MIDNVAELVPWTHWDDHMGEGILCLAVYDEHGHAEGHAVVIDKMGFLHDPANGAFEGENIYGLTRACNVVVAGFIEVKEV